MKPEKNTQVSVSPDETPATHPLDKSENGSKRVGALLLEHLFDSKWMRLYAEKCLTDSGAGIQLWLKPVQRGKDSPAGAGGGFSIVSFQKEDGCFYRVQSGGSSPPQGQAPEKTKLGPEADEMRTQGERFAMHLAALRTVDPWYFADLAPHSVPTSSLQSAPDQPTAMEASGSSPSQGGERAASLTHESENGSSRGSGERRALYAGVIVMVLAMCSLLIPTKDAKNDDTDNPDLRSAKDGNAGLRMDLLNQLVPKAGDLRSGAYLGRGWKVGRFQVERELKTGVQARYYVEVVAETGRNPENVATHYSRREQYLFDSEGKTVLADFEVPSVSSDGSTHPPSDIRSGHILTDPDLNSVIKQLLFMDEARSISNAKRLSLFRAILGENIDSGIVQSAFGEVSVLQKKDGEEEPYFATSARYHLAGEGVAQYFLFSARTGAFVESVQSESAGGKVQHKPITGDRSQIGTALLLAFEEKRNGVKPR